ncbi:hypothetical protein [Aestuariispira insulae]|uniref:Uncharacterized protein n=1 Tax=Aestuariispira insulae TaxID=1461337 RepID=A0A3D9HT55_9PROT|nr:hypothetical protein [Aestuariispira insulae]RED52541.1 hypothetical protein DFP90_102564 [Aestuariispira insulae]
MKAWEKLERRDSEDRRGLQRSFGGQDRRSGIDRREHPEAWDTYWSAKESVNGKTQ